MHLILHTFHITILFDTHKLEVLLAFIIQVSHSPPLFCSSGSRQQLQPFSQYLTQIFINYGGLLYGKPPFVPTKGSLTVEGNLYFDTIFSSLSLSFTFHISGYRISISYARVSMRRYKYFGHPSHRGLCPLMHWRSF